jgi:ABC-type multidrug transport system ATPase subunit
MFYPPFNFAKLFADIGQLSTPKYNPMTGDVTSITGYSFDQLFKSIHISFYDMDSPPAYESMLYLIMNTVLFMILAIYFDQVVRSPRRPIWYFLEPSYWGVHLQRPVVTDPTSEQVEEMSKDAQIEMERVKSNNQDSLRIVNVSKTYSSVWNRITCQKKKQVHALSNMYLQVKRGECLALLGHNGAGKTTLMNILTGLMKPSHGDAFIFGKSVQREMTSIRTILGVCPQHDILFNELSPYQHLVLFAELKGVNTNEIEDILKQVDLYERRFDQCGGFSGGMKRRLSLAISCIGNPQILFLDEPTTGLDVISAKKVWDLIQVMKRDRVMILTTHSMAECDYLSDRIAIMSSGKICCIGNSINLKNRYGSGYRITLVVSESKYLEQVMAQVQQVMQTSITLDSQNSNSLKYTILDHSRVPDLIDQIETDKRIKDWSLSHATLEDVFLHVTNNL